MKRKLAVYIGNNPAPYRVPVFNALAEQPDFDFLALFSTPKEPIRDWNLPDLKFRHIYMRVRYFMFREEHVHVNFDVFKQLFMARPDLLIISGFNFTCIFGFIYSLISGCKLGLMIDGTPFSEARLSWMHRLIRLCVCWRLSLWLGPSDQTLALFRSLGAKPQDCFKSQLCARNEAFETHSSEQAHKAFDLMYCGRFAEGKNPEFAVEVAERVSALLGREVSLLMLGSGPLADQAKARAASAQGVRAEFPGFARQEALPGWYSQCRVFLFPTSIDTWGVVANEACASGLPVMVTPHAGVAGELVLDHETGRVLPLDAKAWAEAIAQLLTQPEEYARMSTKCREVVKGYTFAHAAQGMMDGIRKSLTLPRPHSPDQ
jgi:glycosyltransferase involved in cell wall biosynthesis